MFLRGSGVLLSALVYCLNPVAAEMAASSGFPEAKGQLVSKNVYQSSSAEHVLLQTESGYYQTRPDPKDPEYVHANKEIYVYDHLLQGKIPGPLNFKLYDYVHDCIAAARLDFTEQSPLITDLDGDGHKEVWISYYKGCHGDVSPDELKVFMYKEGIKHSIRGRTFLFVDGKFYGGDYKFDASMSRADPRFRTFGEQLFRYLATERK